MLTKAALKNLLHKPGFSNTDKLLFCLAVDVDTPKAVKEIGALARGAGLRAVSKWNISALLLRSKGLAIRTDSGWELTPDGHDHVAKLAGDVITSPAPKAATNLRTLLASIHDPTIAAFVEEAILCVEAKLYRASVVLSWIGALSVLYEHVVQHELANFNAEAARRDPKRKPAKTRDDLARMKESDFLDILESISVLGKSVKLELQKCLQLRNGCGHPNSLKIGENVVAAHIEALILNVFSCFNV